MEAPERKLPRATLGHGDYDSDFSDDETVEKSCQQKNSEDALLKKPFQKDKHDKVAHRQVAMDEWDREEARNRRFHLIAMDAYARHKKFVNDYILYYGGKKEDFKRSGENDKTDLDVIRENHRFLWREEDEIDMNWEKRLSKKYYDKLFKEYCIADLRKYRDNKFGFRWRHEQEVVSAKGRLRHNSEVNDKAQLSMLLLSVCKDLLEGQFSCGSKHCDEKEGLKSWEVNFGYLEHGQKKNALVKLRLCPECSFKLNFHHRKREVKPGKKQDNQEQSSKILKGKKSRTSSPHRHEAKKKKIHEGPTSLEESNETDEDSGSDDQEDGPSEADFWRGPPQDAEEKTREEEFDEYFQDLFL